MASASITQSKVNAEYSASRCSETSKGDMIKVRRSLHKSAMIMIYSANVCNQMVAIVQLMSNTVLRLPGGYDPMITHLS